MARRDSWDVGGDGTPPSPHAADLHEPSAAVEVPAEPAPIASEGFRRHLDDGRDRYRLWWRGASDNLRGSVYMIGAFVIMAIMTAAIKAIGSRIPLPEILFVRQAVMAVVLIPFFVGDLRGIYRTSRPGLQLLRGLLSLCAMLFGFTAIIHIPLADATALGFSQVLFTTVAAVVILKETVGWRRWAATMVGFVGVLVMLKPTGAGLDAYALLSVAGAAFGCGITISVRMLAQTERTETIMLWQGTVIIIALALPTALMWKTPDLRDLGLMLLVGLVGTLGQWLITKAYQVGEAAALAPLDFIRLLIATAVGYLVFAEIPTASTVAGAVVVIAATIYTVRRNAIVGRARGLRPPA